MFRGVLGVYMVAYTCIVGVHRCNYVNEGVYRLYKGYILEYNIMVSHVPSVTL